jgi:glucose/arabinose dehydrogenase
MIGRRAAVWCSTMLLGAVLSQAELAIRVNRIIASSFDRPVQVTNAGDGSNRLFVVEQGGRVRIIDGGSVLPVPFLDLRSIVSPGSERGLLGLAFHPDYRTNGQFFVDYTNLAGNTVIARYQASSDPNRADAGSAAILLTIAQPAANHNGGQLRFGPLDGYLYIGMGDGGDPSQAQNNTTLLGAMLRIDVDGGSPYAIPPDNPFVGRAGADEIWAVGLRNPWRFSFDRATGDLYIGDVGGDTWEEVDLEQTGTAGGRNYGWPIREGPCPLGRRDPCLPGPSSVTDPIAFYDHPFGRSVTGGFVYRGALFPALEGYYFYADFVAGWVWALRVNGTSSTTPVLLLNAGFNVSSFGEDEAGELYIVDYGGGTVRRVEDARAPPAIQKGLLQ